MKNPETASPLRTEELLKHMGWLQGLARSLVLDDGEADDAVQETWLSALAAGESVRQPRAWLAGTLRNKLKGRRRSEGRRREHETRGSVEAAKHAPEASNSLQVLERQRALLEHVEALPETQRKAILARYYDGLAPREIARREDLAVETVKERLKRGLQSLRRELDREHGDRAAWAGWLLPLATAPSTQVGGVTGFTMGVTILIALILGSLALGGLRGDPSVGDKSGERTATLRTQAPRLEAASEMDEVALESDATTRTAVVPSRRSLRVIVLDRPGGKPVPGASIAFLGSEELRDVQASGMEKFEGPERLLLERGLWLKADEKGAVEFEATAPGLLWASTSQAVGMLPLAEATGELELPLRPCQKVMISVANSMGEPVDGLPVAASLFIDGSRPGMGAGAQDRYTIRRVTKEGNAWVQDPLGFVGHLAQNPDLNWRPVWTDFRIDLPGVTHGRLRSEVHTQVPMLEPAPGRALISLVEPETGALALRILDAERDSEALDGGAFLRVPGDEVTHRATVENGMARWPRVLLGQQFTIALSLPGLGSQWSLEASGPVAAGEERIVETVRPRRAAILGRLIDAENQPVGEIEFFVYHRVHGEIYSDRALSVRTATDGSFRFEWPDPSRVDGPIQLVHRGRRRGGSIEIDLPRSELLRGTDLGEIEFEIASIPVLTGMVVNAEGEPLQGIQVTVRGHGSGRGGETDKRGRFTLQQLFGSEVKIEARDYSGRYPEKTVRVPRADASEEVVITLRRGARVFGQIARGDLPLDGAYREVVLRSLDGDDFASGLVQEDGSFEAFGLKEGRWRASLSQFNAMIYDLGEIDLAAGEERELIFPALDSILRRLNDRLAEGSEELAVRATVSGPRGDLGGTEAKGFFLVPRTGSHAVRFSCRGRRSLVLPDANALEDGFEVHLEPSLQVRLLPASVIPPNVRFVLEPEPGSAAEGELQVLMGEPGGQAHVDVELGSPGLYRLVRRNGGKARGGVATLGERKTTEVFEVLDQAERQEIVIDFEAPTID